MIYVWILVSVVELTVPLKHMIHCRLKTLKEVKWQFAVSWNILIAMVLRPFGVWLICFVQFSLAMSNIYTQFVVIKMSYDVFCTFNKNSR